MNYDEILKNPSINGGDDYITKLISREILDQETGELITHDTQRSIMLGKEPPYVKIYTDCMLVLNKVDLALSAPLIAFCHHMSYANDRNVMYRHVVRTDALVRRDVAARCDISEARVKQYIKQFVDCEIFIPISYNGKRQRGIYYVNPWVIGKGDWKDIQELRGEFRFTENVDTVGVCKIADDGKRDILVQKTLRKKKKNVLPDGQMSFLEENEQG